MNEIGITKEKLKKDHYECLKIKEELEKKLNNLMSQGQQAQQTQKEIIANNGILNYITELLKTIEEKETKDDKG